MDSPSPFLTTCCLLALALGLTPDANAGVPADAQVVLVVDTSVSMSKPGMDPERTSLLVARLYADIVPGDLAVIRLLDLKRDEGVLRSEPTGKMVPCGAEQESRECIEVKPLGEGGWEGGARAARGVEQEGYGVLTRSGEADTRRFKAALDSHLMQTAQYSMFELAFRSAQGFFDEGRTSMARRQFLLWLSDGVPEEKKRSLIINTASDVIKQGIVMEALVFGRGDTSMAEELHLTPRRTTTPSEIMAAFADVFRRIVEAPFRADGIVATDPTFSVKKYVREAWVVVYGDTTLNSAYVEGPSGRIECDDATDTVPQAGTYRVARINEPTQGQWTVHVVGGGATAAYAVIQRPGLRAALAGPEERLGGQSVPIVAVIESDLDGQRITEPDILAGITIEIDIDGHLLPAFDDGKNGDAAAGDGQYTASYTFPKTGSFPVNIHAKSETLDSRAPGTIEIQPGLAYRGGPIDLEFGTLGWGETRCVPLRFDADLSTSPQVVPAALQVLPPGHTFLLRLPDRDVPMGTAFPLSTGLQIQVCLVVDDMAKSSEATGGPALELRTGPGAEAAVTVTGRWRVIGRPWWERHKAEIIGGLGLLVLAGIGYGWIWPTRFERRLGLQLSATPDLDQGDFYAFRLFRGTGAGWYSHAVAYLHDNYRISGGTWRRGTPRGATVCFSARAKAVRLHAIGGHRLEWTNGDGEWDLVPEDGHVAPVGRLYRVASANGLYFSIRRG